MAKEQFFTPISGKSNVDTLILKDDDIEISDDVIEISDDVIEILDDDIEISDKSNYKLEPKKEKQVKRGRGRPPKTQKKITKSKANKMVTTESCKVKRGRGRPRKNI